jgi:hypothetical protein
LLYTDVISFQIKLLCRFWNVLGLLTFVVFATFSKNWAIFFQPSGHTVDDEKKFSDVDDRSKPDRGEFCLRSGDERVNHNVGLVTIL